MFSDDLIEDGLHMTCGTVYARWPVYMRGL